MEKLKVYYIENNNFRHYLRDYLENSIKEDLVYSISEKYSEMKYIFDDSERKTKIKYIIKRLQKEIKVDYFQNFTYVFDFTTKSLKFDISTLSDVELHISNNSPNLLEIFSLSENIEISYNLANVCAIEVDNEDDLYNTFVDVNVLLMTMVRKFILFEYWIKEYKKLPKKDTQVIIKTPIHETKDLSNTKGTEKVIMLKQLGILDFLKRIQPFNLSTNALASALSGITGIETGTLQSYINPIDNPNVNQKNNPLNSEKAVNKVTQKLISIGFTPTK